MCVIYHLVVITRSSGLTKYFILPTTCSNTELKEKKRLCISKNSFFINFLGHKVYPWLASCRAWRLSNNSGFWKSTVECPSTSPPWCKDQGMRIPLDTGPLEEGRSNMSFDYLYTNFELIKFHDFPWLMLIFEKFLSYLHFWDYQQSKKKHNSVEHLQRQQFSFTKTNEYLSVSKNLQVFTSKLKD